MSYDPSSIEEEQAAIELEPALAARRRAEAERLTALAHKAPASSPGCRPYARPAGVRSALHRCRSCGDVLLPSYVRGYRSATGDSLGVPERCWGCVEATAVDSTMLRKAIG